MKNKVEGKYESEAYDKSGGLDPYQALANQIIVQAADDYCSAYLTWLSTCPHFHMKNFTSLRRGATPNGLMDFDRQEAESVIYETIKFFHSKWFSHLTLLDPTVFHEQLRKKSVMPNLRRKLKTLEAYRKGEKIKESKRIIYMIANVVERKDDCTLIVNSYAQEDQYRRFAKHFTIHSDNPTRIPKKVKEGDKIALFGEYQSHNKRYIDLYNITTDIEAKQMELETKIITTYREARDKCIEAK